MAKHSGCFLCGDETQEILISVPLFHKMHSIAICPICHKLSSQEIKRQVEAIDFAIAASRKAARAGASEQPRKD